MPRGIHNEFVLIAMRVHLFPSRTQKLSSSAPTILGGRLPGKIGNANTKDHNESCGLFLVVNPNTPDGSPAVTIPWPTWENK